MTKSRVKLSNEMSAEEAAELISNIALGIATGEIWLEADETGEFLHPGSPVKVDVKGGEGREEGKLSIEITWKTQLRIYGLSPREHLKEGRNGRRR